MSQIEFEPFGERMHDEAGPSKTPGSSCMRSPTIISMAALGLGVDVRIIGRVGGRVTAAVTLSLMLLLIISLGLIFVLKLG